MASEPEMAKLESLNSFFYERLMAVAGEIFQAVKDTFSEYQLEMHRSKQENLYLRKMLAEVSLNSGSDSQLSHRDGVSPQDTNHGLLHSSTSVVQVKLELCTAQQDSEPDQPIKGSSSRSSPCAPPDCTQEPPHSFSVKICNSGGKKDDCLPTGTQRNDCSGAWNCQVISSDDSNPMSESGCENQLVEVKDEPDSKPYTRCEESYSAFAHRSLHLQSHATDKLLNCKVCGKPFKYDRLLKAHMVVHQKERPYHCELCGKCYSYAHVLKIHLRTHTGERPYHCRYCGKTFNQKGHVKGHERIHTGEKIYSCSACGKHFTWLGQGKEHLRTHHDQLATIIRKRKSNC